MMREPTGLEWPSVSGVIVTRAGDPFLRRAIRSVVSQRYPGRIECIVVFDQSPAFDLTDVAPADGGDRALRVIENRRSPGLAGARNAGADRAFGDVLSFCGADDEWLPHKVSYQIVALEAAGADVAVAGTQVHIRGRVLERVPASDHVSIPVLLRSRQTEIHPSTIAVRREAFHSTIGPFDEAIRASHAAELDWLLRAAAAADLVALRVPLVCLDPVDGRLETRWRGTPRRGRPQRSERRRDRGMERAALRAPFRSASRSAT